MANHRKSVAPVIAWTFGARDRVPFVFELDQFLIQPLNLIHGGDHVAERLRDMIAAVDEIERLNKKLIQLKNKRDAIPRTKRPRDYRRYAFAVVRHRIIISKLIRSIEFTHAERKRLIDTIRQGVEKMR